MRVLIVTALVLLAACSQENPASTRAMAPAEAPATELASMDAVSGGAPQAQRAPADAPAPAGGAQNAPAQASPTLYLAYAYSMSIETPADRLVSVMESHIAACRDAGPRVCQLISAGRDGDAQTYLQGSLSLRAEPQWLQRFMGRVEADAEQARGRVRAKSTSTEDLTRSIIDTEARLRAMTTLRDRLQTLLASRPGRLSDLLEVERELARVQGELDATRSNLAAMRARVDMSELTINYQSQPRSVTTSTFEPLGEAFANFLRNVVGGLAAIVTLIAVALPWAIVLGLLAWGGRKLWLMRKTQAQKPADNQP